jgi:hypothetical protein
MDYIVIFTYIIIYFDHIHPLCDSYKFQHKELFNLKTQKGAIEKTNSKDWHSLHLPFTITSVKSDFKNIYFDLES